MRNTILKSAMILLTVITVAATSSCKKETDWASDWVGTYNGSTGGTVQRVVITKVNNTTIKMELQSNSIVGYLTFATIGNGTLTKDNLVTIDEDGTIAGQNGTWRFTGSGTLSGSTISLTGQATQPGQSTQYYAFTGSR